MANQRPARPSAPFNAIIVVSREVRENGEVVSHECIGINEISAFDARDAWAFGEDACAISEDEGNRGIHKHIQGVVGPAGWEVAPAWVSPEAQRSPKEQAAAWKAHFRAQDDASAFA